MRMIVSEKEVSKLFDLKAKLAGRYFGERALQFWQGQIHRIIFDFFAEALNGL